MRRAHAILVILTLLATPFALAAGVDSCAAGTYANCPICASAQHGKMAACNCPMRRSGKCGSGSQSQFPDFALAAPLAPTAPLPFFQMNAPSSARAEWAETQAASAAGFFAPPFAPPRS
jgi:hypothetical protein